ncbi:hypothetical protein J7K43_01555 [Candidatus Calescamantes bacterium]|nr:hypothetical protein [Candidatus Calescamantes bacterium]
MKFMVKFLVLVLFIVLLSQSQMLAEKKTISLDLSYFQPDKIFPEYGKYWWEDWSHKDKNGFNIQFYPECFTQGGSFHIYLKNITSRIVKVKDVLINGISLRQEVRNG